MEQKHGFIIFDFYSNGDLLAIVFCERQGNHLQIRWLIFESVPKDNPTPLLCVFLHSSWSQCRAKKCQPHAARVFRTAPMETFRSRTTKLPTWVLMAVFISYGCYNELPRMERFKYCLFLSHSSRS